MTPAARSSSEQLQFNPPNLPMFKKGTAPFMGDYVDVTVAPAFVPTANGAGCYNTDGAQPVFHAVWTDNRDVRQPARTTPTATATRGTTTRRRRSCDGRRAEHLRPAQTLPACNPLNTGLAQPEHLHGAALGGPGRRVRRATPSRSARPLQRAFVVFAQNTTTQTKAFRMTIASQPAGGRASFASSTSAQARRSPPLGRDRRGAGSLDGARTVYATSTDPTRRSSVERHRGRRYRRHRRPAVRWPTHHPEPGHANPISRTPTSRIPTSRTPTSPMPRSTTPDIANPDIANPDIANPDIANPDIANPDIANPDIDERPDIANPDIANVARGEPGHREPGHRESGHREPGYREPGHRESRHREPGHRERDADRRDVDDDEQRATRRRRST